MTTTEVIGRPDGPDGAEYGGPPDPDDAAERASDASFHARPCASEHRAHDERLGAIGTLIGVVPVHGPPLILLAAPLVLLATALAGPFLLLLTLAAVLVAGTVLIVLAGAIVASPYLLVRHVLAHRAARAPASAPAAQLVLVPSRRGSA